MAALILSKRFAEKKRQVVDAVEPAWAGTIPQIPFRISGTVDVLICFQISSQIKVYVLSVHEYAYITRMVLAIWSRD